MTTGATARNPLINSNRDIHKAAIRRRANRVNTALLAHRLIQAADKRATAD
jgi:4'-phosphopantetheinyl transferase EntD